jgi:magnesium chelatase family protein
MVSHTCSAVTHGIDATLLDVETHLEHGLPAFQIVGLPDSTVRESRERVTAAIKHSPFGFPLGKITINLAPADVRKEGAALDLPIAVGVLTSAGTVDAERTRGWVFLGQLALDGTVRAVPGVLPVALMVRRRGLKRIVVPEENADEAALVTGVEVYAVRTLEDAIALLTGASRPAPRTVDIDAVFHQRGEEHGPDMCDVKGQLGVKRAMEVAAAGGHNIIMVGPPGSGKTMIAKRLPGILPPLTVGEALETTTIHSVSGTLPPGNGLVTRRPFRAPHHTISDSALVGGGMGTVRPGEISLAHHGILFLDELPEFARNVLEVMRQPLEEKRITIARSRMTVEYPANMMLVCSMNPCPCGHFGSTVQECTCQLPAIQRYLSKVSGPLLDRIDLHVDVPAVRVDDLAHAPAGESSAVIRERVVRARRRQLERFAKHPGLFKNADMSSRDIERYCALGSDSLDLLRTAMTALGLSARAYDRILKVSRTIADLEGATDIDSRHVAEAVHYRSLDRPFWNG